jgi:hypothetical protein
MLEDALSGGYLVHAHVLMHVHAEIVPYQYISSASMETALCCSPQGGLPNDASDVQESLTNHQLEQFGVELAQCQVSS